MGINNDLCDFLKRSAKGEAIDIQDDAINKISEVHNCELGFYGVAHTPSERNKKMELNYYRRGDYLFPDLIIDEEEVSIGKYGMLRRTFLKENRKNWYQSMMLTERKKTSWHGRHI